MPTRTYSGSWSGLAACRHVDPELFFPVTESGPAQRQVAQAKAVCSRCPVTQFCLDYALENRQVHGIWGGTTEAERRQHAVALTAGTRRVG
jgi:WhiB family transcriptional regulator, redox-sensing transcriptional regulator